MKLDFRRFDDGYVATASDVKAELERIGYELKPMDIVLVNTRAGERYVRTRDPKIIWERHYACIDTPHCHMEKLRHPEALPPDQSKSKISPRKPFFLRR